MYECVSVKNSENYFARISFVLTYYPNRQRAHQEHAQIFAEHSHVSMLFHTNTDATTLPP